MARTATPRTAGKRRASVVHDEPEVSEIQPLTLEEATERAVEEQHELLVEAAANVGQGSSSSDGRRPASTARQAKESATIREAANGAGLNHEPAAKKKKKKRLGDLAGFADLKQSDTGNSTGGGKAKKPKEVNAVCRLARYQTGEKRGKPSGAVYFVLNCLYENNKQYQALTKDVVHSSARWFPDWGGWAVKVATREIAQLLFNAIKKDKDMLATSRLMKPSMDATAFDDESYKKPTLQVAMSSTFETVQGGQFEILPRSVLIVGAAYDFKEYLKKRWETIRYTDIVYGEGPTKITKAAWVLPCTSETPETGTLADYLRQLGVEVDEYDLDDEDDDEEEEDDDDVSPDADGLIDAEAVEEEVVWSGNEDSHDDDEDM